MSQKVNSLSPLVSFVIAAYNAEGDIDRCLSSIKKQTYPMNRIEILVIDGGSSDETVKIAKSYGARIINNPDRIAEFAKSLGIQRAQGKYIVILDTDNEIVQEDWLEKMVSVLEKDYSIVGMDPVFLVKKDDFLVNRYCALLGLEDPVVRYMADLSRNASIEEHEKYSVYKIRAGRFPIFGSNGFIWRKEVFDEIKSYIPRYDEAEFCIEVVERGYAKIGFVKDCNIHHHHLKTIAQFIGKRFRRGREFMTRKLMVKETKKVESGVWLDKYSKWEFLGSVFLCISIIYPTYECIKGYLGDKDCAWFLHPLLSLLTVLIYIHVFIVYNLSIRRER